MPEQWRPCKGYEQSHDISTRGRIRSVDRIVTTTDGRQQRHYRSKLIKITNGQVPMGFGDQKSVADLYEKTFGIPLYRM